MLTFLRIRDFALIESIELELRPGLTVLTGETGAGKSILVDALQLLAGGRAGAEVIRHGAERAEITATFDLSRTSRELRRWLEQQSISPSEELSIRRIVASDGRSRAYLNGQVVPIQLLREAGNILIDIHGQHEFQSLTRSAAQRELLDGYGRLESAAAQVGIAHRVWLELLNRTLETETKARDRDAKLELLRYQVSELQALQLGEDEFARLTEERARLVNGEKLAAATETALQLLYESDTGSAHAGVSRALQTLRGLCVLDAKVSGVTALVDEASIQIREAARELAHYRDNLQLDTARQDQVEKRLAAIEELARKNRVPPAELSGRQSHLARELESLQRAEMDLAVLRRDLASALDSYRTLATQLSAKRTTAGRALAKDITTRMQSLGMSGGRFQVEVTPEESAEPSEHGLDQIDFRVTANPGQPLRPLSKVASGGELSRLSLAIQVSCAVRDVRSMVFDEVDTGIGGAVAEIVGSELRSLAERGQVLCVTHLPQVAGQGHQHLRVLKLTDGRSTKISVNELAPDDRVEELARMLGGIEITAKAREHAREMLHPPASAASAGPASSAPASTDPASTDPSSTDPTSAVPSSTDPSSAVPSSTDPTGAVPTTTGSVADAASLDADDDGVTHAILSGADLLPPQPKQPTERAERPEPAAPGSAASEQSRKAKTGEAEAPVLRARPAAKRR